MTPTATRRRPSLHHAVTLEQYRDLELSRPLTDGPIGQFSAGKRSTDATASAAIPVTPPTGGPT